MKLSDDLQYWRVERPSEWKMDEFIRKAMKLESLLDTCVSIYYVPPLDLPPQNNEDIKQVLGKFKELVDYYRGDNL